MQPLFTPEFFVQNRRSLQAACPDTELIVVTANGLLQRSSDSTFDFQQDRSFWYLTGLDQPDTTLVIDGAATYLIVPELSQYQTIFDGEADQAELTKISGIDEIVSSEDGWRRLRAALDKHGKVGTPLAMPDYVEVYGMHTNPSRRELIKKLREQHATLDVVDIRPALARLRSLKQPVELAAIQQAIDITINGINNVVSNLANYKHEYEIEADLSRDFRRTGASGHAFTPIVSGGKRACVLHNISNNAALADNEMIVIDVGAEVSHYAADISRTVIQGVQSARQQAVYEAVLTVQKYALGLLKSGTLLKEYEKQVELFMGGQLIKLGLLTDESVKTPANIRRYFPHSTSHFMGLDVHDVGDGRQPLEESMVLTCEPGIYIPEEGIGVRIEDDVVITKDGHQVLTAALPQQLSSVVKLA